MNPLLLLLLACPFLVAQQAEFPIRSGDTARQGEPGAPDLPEALRAPALEPVEEFKDAAEAERDPRGAGNPERRDGERNDFPSRETPEGLRGEEKWRREARRAAQWTAEEYGQPRAWREYFQVGFHAGLKSAMSDGYLLRGDHEDGLHDGRSDSRARRQGRDQARRRAEQLAEECAAREVEEQFQDLEWRPHADPHPRIPDADLGPYQPYAAPELQDVLRDFPYTSQRTFPLDSFADGWRPDPERLLVCDRYQDFYSDQWRESKRAFACWNEDRRRASGYRQLNREDQHHFEAVFARSYLGNVGGWLHRNGERVYRQGFSSGWHYGALVHGEWAYRKGYCQGAAEAMQQVVEAHFSEAFPLAYETAYLDHFESFQRRAVLRLAGLHLQDENDDGVLEPGETVGVVAIVRNLGGREGQAKLAVGRGTLGRELKGDAAVQARSERRIALGQAVLASKEEVPFQLDVQAQIGEDTAIFPFILEFPVSFAEFTIRCNGAQGSAFLRLALRNKASQSKRVTVSGPGLERNHALRLGGKQQQVLEVQLGGLDPLELIAGWVHLEYLLEGSGRRWHALSLDLPGSATDLANPDLLECTFLMAQGSQQAGNGDLFFQLWRERMLADWERQAKAEGNPYKADLQEGGQRSELGKLVALFQQHRRALRHPEWFTRLGDTFRHQAEELPGSHPFLRRAFRQLAQRLSE